MRSPSLSATRVPDAQLRVLVDGAVLRRPETGVGRWVGGIVRALSDRDDVCVQVGRGPRLIRRGGPLHRVPNLLTERWWYEAGIAGTARRLAAEVLLMPAGLSARQGRIPQVVTVHDVNFLTVPDAYERTYRSYAKWAFRRSILEADRATTVSEFSRHEISAQLGVDPARLEVVYPGLDEPAEARGPAPLERPYALFVGATELHKNVGSLLAAWLRGSPAGLALAIVGRPGRDHEHLLSMAGRCGGRVIVRGSVDQEELERWYRHARVFVFLSRSEGFGYPPLEAMLRGVPVVASDRGSLPEVLGEAALYLDPDDVEGLRAAVERVADDGPERSQRIKMGSIRAHAFSWTVTGAAMTEILQEARLHGKASLAGPRTAAR